MSFNCMLVPIFTSNFCQFAMSNDFSAVLRLKFTLIVFLEIMIEHIDIKGCRGKTERVIVMLFYDKPQISIYRL